MRKGQFLQHLQAAMDQVGREIEQLPDNAQVSSVTVTDRTGFETVGEKLPNGTYAREYKERVHVTAKVKMLFTVESKNDRGTITASKATY